MALNNNTTNDEFLSIVSLIESRHPNKFNNNDIFSVYLKKLSNSDIILKNKDKEKTGKTTHIACTGISMNFFYDSIGSLKVNGNLKNEEDSVLEVFTFNSDLNKFIMSKVAIWINPKSDNNQIGISKDRVDSEEFKKFREKIYPGDFLIFFKYFNNSKDTVEIYAIHVPKEDHLLNKLNFKLDGNYLIKYYDRFNKDLNLDVDEDEFTYGEIIGYNRLYYGSPGSGKSYTVQQKYENKNSIRVLFHKEFSYGDFIGYIKPVIIKDENYNEKLIYKFDRGPFTEILIKALKNPHDMFTLIIEEINRANAPTVFGDLFQLLDRNNSGSSEYFVTNKDIFSEIKIELGDKYKLDNHKIYIPHNLRIIATMNNSDQNTDPLDTAFKRRWEFVYIPIDFKGHPFKDQVIQSFNVSWEKFVTEVNSFMLNDYNKDLMISEDKQIGQFFVKEDDLSDFNKFSYKVLLYLWDDVFKYNRDRIFKPYILSFTQLLSAAQTHGVDIFVDELANNLS